MSTDHHSCVEYAVWNFWTIDIILLPSLQEEKKKVMKSSVRFSTAELGKLVHIVPLYEKHLCQMNQVSTTYCLSLFLWWDTSDMSGIFFVRLLDRMKFHTEKVRGADAKNNAEIFISMTILIFLLTHTFQFLVSLHFGFHNTFQLQGLWHRDSFLTWRKFYA